MKNHWLRQIENKKSNLPYFTYTTWNTCGTCIGSNGTSGFDSGTTYTIGSNGTAGFSGNFIDFNISGNSVFVISATSASA